MSMKKILSILAALVLLLAARAGADFVAPYDPAAFYELVKSRVAVPVVNVLEKTIWN